MKNIVILSLFMLLVSCKNQQNVLNKVESAEIQALRKSRITLPNGWSLTPFGNSIKLQDLPLNLVVSTSKALVAITNNGQSTQSITLIDANSEEILDDISIAKAFVGLAFIMVAAR